MPPFLQIFLEQLNFTAGFLGLQARAQERRELDAEVQALKHRLQQAGIVVVLTLPPIIMVHPSGKMMGVSPIGSSWNPIQVKNDGSISLQ